ncbi:ABC transporter G family member 23-like [Neocloeon triangulifer]|uniref:ABC transporter G family member 23-like n=1 Tax=Neocloeon triangulifer TaxID=2078957 RepID=UPI00286F8634|nr:ABC transporter G family member 23-like [Neocloeon triangulifer]
MQSAPSGAAVSVREAYKYYGSSKSPKVVLDRLNMTVPRGAIYGLLGASGCGKTTLLTCIVGRRKLKSGDVWILGGRPGSPGSGVPGPRIGYMPQDIALFGDFSIRDTMFYFGKIFGMSNREVEERATFLHRMLELPPDDRLVGNLSGGQQRRVSFAAALLHDPELLILDEPTVGVDPVLRQRIWDHLMYITQTGNKTVIITTHYIEEARQAGTIGLMRNGTLLAEDSPSELLTLYGCSSLEDVFLLLSRKQGRNSQDMVADAEDPEEMANVQRQQQTQQENRRNSMEVVSHQQDQGMNLQAAYRKNTTTASTATLTNNTDEIHIPSSIRRTLKNRASRIGKMESLLKKNILRYWRNFGLMMFILGFPLLQIGAFFLAIGHDPRHLPVAVVNDEVPWYRAGPGPSYTGGPLFVENDRCLGMIVPGCNMTRLSCRFLDALDPTFVTKRYYSDLKSAQAAVKAGEVWGTMHFGANFSAALEERKERGKDTSDEALEMGELGVWLDMSDRQIGLLLKKQILDSYKKFFKELLSDCELNHKYGEVPIQFKPPIYGVEYPSYTMFMAPGVILTVVFFLSTGITCTTMISEVHEGIWDRALVTGITASEILLSHVLTQMLVLFAQTIECLLLSFLLFGMTSNGSIILVTLLTVLEGFCGMCFGFLISIVCENISAANYLSIGSFYPMILLCGIVWPLEGMPSGLRAFSLQLPLTRSTDSLRNIMTKGWGITEPGVYEGFLATFIWILVLLALCVVGLRIKKG